MKNGLKPGAGAIAEQPAALREAVRQSRSPQSDSALIAQAIAGVLRHAQDGDLPLFAWTLGLPQDAWLAMLDAYFPELGALEAMPSKAYAAIEKTAPGFFRQMAFMLYEQRQADANAVHADWLARAIAAGCFGSRHLWQDLGLRGPDDVSALLSAYFPALHAKNIQHLKWKRFLFAEAAALAALRNDPEIMPPNCSRCDEFPICFPVES